MRSGDTIRSASRLAAAAFLSATAVLCQVSHGTLTGYILDQQQGGIPGAVVTLTNQLTGVVQATKSSDQGEYVFPLLQVGRYRLAVQAVSFQPYNRSDIAIELGRVERLDIGLSVGTVAEAVEVSGRAPLLESESATVSQFIENETIAAMPLVGRRVADLVALMGNTVLINPDVNFPRIVTAGGRADQQMWLLDGVTAQNVTLDVPQTNFNPPVESTQEFRLLQNNYSAEYGNTTSGVISFSTKSGTNRLRGSLYEFFRNDKLDARNFFAVSKAPLRWNTFGFAVGGPVVRNKTFFFVSTEWQKQRIGVTRVLTVPTAAERTGDFSRTVTAAGAVLPVYDPATSRPDPANPSGTIRSAFPGNVIPANRLDAVGTRIASYLPVPNRPATNLAGANNFVANGVNGVNNTTLTVKVDHNFRDTDRLSGRVVVYDLPNYSTAVFPEAAADPFASLNVPREYSFLVSETHTFRPTLVNDFRFNWQPRTFTRTTPGEGQGWPAKLGLKGVAERAFPYVTAAGYVSLGNFFQYIRHEPRDMHIVDSLSWFRGSHALKLGGELRQARFNLTEGRWDSGFLSFGPQATALPNVVNTGNAVASLLVGFPQSGQIFSQDPLARRSTYVALFIQDDWKVAQNVTVNLGLRWEAHTPRTDAQNRQNGFDRAAINPVSQTPGIVTFAGRDGYPATVYDGDYNNFGPRIGLAWKPAGKQNIVIRAGYGVFFGPPVPGSNNASASFETSGTFNSPDNGITAPFLLRDGLPLVQRAQPSPGFGAAPPGTAPRFAPQFFDRTRQLGYSQQWNFGIQRSLAGDALVEATYMGNGAHRLPGPNTSFNQVPVNLLGPGNAQLRRPFPQFSDLVMISPVWGNSSYHSLNIRAEKRFSKGFNYLANYTFAKFLDDVPSNQELGALPGGMQNLYDRRAEKARSGNDIRHRLVLSTVYELPWGKGRRWLNRGPAAVLLGGWNLGAMLLAQGGPPMGLTALVNTLNAFNPGAQRVNLLRDPGLDGPARSMTRWFDTAAAAAPPAYTFGNAGRAVLSAPGITTLDFSLLKNHRVAERYNVQFRWEAFNSLNHANFLPPGGALGAANFGVITGARDARRMQFALKLEF